MPDTKMLEFFTGFRIYASSQIILVLRDGKSFVVQKYSYNPNWMFGPFADRICGMEASGFVSTIFFGKVDVTIAAHACFPHLQVLPVSVRLSFSRKTYAH